MRPTRSFWETTGKAALPLCSDLALRLSVVVVQSADVERMCKSHSIIHKKSHNRLQHDRVKKLLYCYINLRITSKERSEPTDFLLSVDDNDYELEDGDEVVVEDDENNEEQGAAILQLEEGSN